MGRLRVTFGRGEPVKYLAHLDLVRLWERAIRRAELPLAYSAGFTPRPKMTMAAPLPVGVTSEGELMDLIFEAALSPAEFTARITPQLPAGVAVLAASQAPERGPSLPALLAAAEYRVTVRSTEAEDDLPATDRAADLQARIDRLLATAGQPVVRERAGKVREYDLRPLILDLRSAGGDTNGLSVTMRLRAGNEATGRPEDVAAALGYPGRPRRIHRTKLFLREDSSIDE